jgi:hypothetical protein
MHLFSESADLTFSNNCHLAAIIESLLAPQAICKEVSLDEDPRDQCDRADGFGLEGRLNDRAAAGSETRSNRQVSGRQPPEDQTLMTK